jgi:hypothetical protein
MAMSTTQALWPAALALTAALFGRAMQRSETSFDPPAHGSGWG